MNGYAETNSKVSITGIEQRLMINMLSRYSARIIYMGVSFFLTPFLISNLGPALLGLQVLANQSLEYCLLFNSAVNQGYSRFATIHYARSDFRQMNLILGKGLALTALLAVPVMLGAAVLALLADVLFALTPDILWYGRVVILISGAGVLIGMFIGVWSSSLFITQRFYLDDIGTIITSVLSTGGVVLMFHYFQPSIIVWVSITVGSGLLVRLLFVVPAAKHGLPEMKIRPCFSMGKEFWKMVNFSGLSLLGSLGYLLYYSSDSIIISNLDELGPGKIFAYNLGQRWDPFVRWVVLAFAYSLTPTLTSLVALNNFDALKRVLYRGTRYCLLLGLFPCIVLFGFSEPFIRCWVGQSFVHESDAILRLVMINVSVSIPAILGYQVLFALGKLKEAVLATIIGGVCNIILSVILVKYAGMGLIGVALGTVITLGLKNSVYIPFLVNSKLDIGLWAYWRYGHLRAVLCAVPLIAACVVLRVLWEPIGWRPLLGQLSICGLIYVGSTWFIGLTKQDKDKLRNVIRKARSFPSFILEKRNRS